jgi:enhancing lycopene biosynthesis protein 2
MLFSYVGITLSGANFKAGIKTHEKVLIFLRALHRAGIAVFYVTANRTNRHERKHIKTFVSFVRAGQRSDVVICLKTMRSYEVYAKKVYAARKISRLITGASNRD